MTQFRVLTKAWYSCWDRPMPHGTAEELVNVMRKCLDGYRDGDLVRPAWTEIIDHTNYVHCGDDDHSRPCYEGIYHDLFSKYNADDRPDGDTERSMCVGDCVQFSTGEADIRTFTVYRNTFVEVDNPRNIYLG